MPESIGHRHLRNDNAEIMRRVEAGESFVITRNGTPIADLIPRARNPKPPRYTGREQQECFRALPPMDVKQWSRERVETDQFFRDDRVE